MCPFLLRKMIGLPLQFSIQHLREISPCRAIERKRSNEATRLIIGVVMKRKEGDYLSNKHLRDIALLCSNDISDR
jgi:hypothetical protein